MKTSLGFDRLGRRPLSLLARRVCGGIVFCSFVLSLLVLPLQAQGSATGTVEGRVQNAATGNYLTNARVRVAGTSLETFTNSSGEYRITGVPPGQATLNIFYTGMAPQQVSVTVPASAVTQQDVS